MIAYVVKNKYIDMAVRNGGIRIFLGACILNQLIQQATEGKGNLTAVSSMNTYQPPWTQQRSYRALSYPLPHKRVNHLLQSNQAVF